MILFLALVTVNAPHPHPNKHEKARLRNHMRRVLTNYARHGVSRPYRLGLTRVKRVRSDARRACIWREVVASPDFGEVTEWSSKGRATHAMCT